MRPFSDKRRGRVKIVERGNPPPPRRWMRKNWECSHCKTVIYLDDSDIDLEVEYKDAQRDGSWIVLVCPVCRLSQNFYEHKFKPKTEWGR